MADSPKYRKQFVPAATAANLAGVNVRTLRRWKEDGSAIAQNEKGNYELISVLLVAIEKARASGDELTKARINQLNAAAKKAEADAEWKQLEIEAKKESLVDAGEVQALWSDQLSKIRNKLLTFENVLPYQLESAIPLKLGTQIKPEDRNEMLLAWQQVIKAVVYEALHELAKE